MGKADSEWGPWGPFMGWGGPGGPRRRGGRRSGVRWSVFERGDLKFVILRLLSEKPMHGYEVMRALEEESRGCYRASPGSVYPTLQMLEDQGFVRAEAQDEKKVYSVTDEGRAYLEENSQQVDDIFDRVSGFADRFFGKEMRDLSNSFAKLARETFEDAFQWAEDSSFVEEMKDVLDEAAEKMRDARDAARAARGARRRGGRSHASAEAAPEPDVTSEEAPAGDVPDEGEAPAAGSPA